MRPFVARYSEMLGMSHWSGSFPMMTSLTKAPITFSGRKAQRIVRTWSQHTHFLSPLWCLGLDLKYSAKPESWPWSSLQLDWDFSSVVLTWVGLQLSVLVHSVHKLKISSSCVCLALRHHLHAADSPDSIPISDLSSEWPTWYSYLAVSLEFQIY
jgi:hypothetical protein